MKTKPHKPLFPLTKELLTEFCKRCIKPSLVLPTRIARASSTCNSIVDQSTKRCKILQFCPIATKSEGWNNESRNQRQTKEKAASVASLATQTALLYENHTLHKKHNDHFSFALKRAKPKISSNLLHHPKIKYFRFHTVFSSLIRQSLPSLGTAAIYRTQDKEFPCECMRVCVHIFYSIVNMDVTKKKSSLQYHFTTFF